MNIRPAVPADAHRFWRIHTASIRALAQDAYDPDQIEAWVNHRCVADFRQRILRDQSYVAEIDGQVVGYIRFSPRTGELCSLHVDPAYARRGVGTALLGTAVKAARGLEMTHFWLHASHNAVPFYQSQGFTPTKEAVHLFGNVGLACVEMTMDLNRGHTHSKNRNPKGFSTT
jgi:putative acetyltransferase